MKALKYVAAASAAKRFFWVVAHAKIVVPVAIVLLVVVSVAAPRPQSQRHPDLPEIAALAYQNAAPNCEGLDWTILGGIGKVETNHGRIWDRTTGPNGDIDPAIFGPELNGSGVGGNVTSYPIGEWDQWFGLTGQWLRAVGPMQFLPGTFDAFATDGNNDGAINPHNIFDAAATAATYLCDGGDIVTPADARTALYTYNASDTYVAEVIYWANIYSNTGGVAFSARDITELLDHPNIELAPRARADLIAGVVDPRLISLLVNAGDRFQLSVGFFKAGHADCVGGASVTTNPTCQLSNHYFGRAVDIGAVGYPGAYRSLVTAANQPARALVDELGAAATGDPLRPDSVGSPWNVAGYPGHFTDRGHLGHLHIAYRATNPDIANPTDAPRPGPITGPSTATPN